MDVACLSYPGLISFSDRQIEKSGRGYEEALQERCGTGIDDNPVRWRQSLLVKQRAPPLYRNVTVTDLSVSHQIGSSSSFGPVGLLRYVHVQEHVPSTGSYRGTKSRYPA